MGAIISAQNSKLLQPSQEKKRMCNCRQKNECPVSGKCLEKSIIYRASETRTMGKPTYTGLTCNDFKSRWVAHKNSFNNIEANQTTLSSFLNKLKSKTVKFDLKWVIIDRAKTVNPVTGISIP